MFKHKKYWAALLCAVLLFTTVTAGLTGCSKSRNTASSEGLEMTLNPDGESYTCMGIGTCTDTEIIIDTHKDLPVTAIGGAAFYGQTKLTQITVGERVTEIGRMALVGCTALTAITVDGDNPAYTSVGGNLYSKDGKTLYQYALGKTDAAFELPVGVTHIENGAFSGCAALQSVRLSADVISLGDWIFRDCTALREITVDTENPAYKSVDGILYTKDGATLVLYPTGKTDARFTLPEGVAAIGNCAFYGNKSLKEITLSDALKSIGNEAFFGCTDLTSLILSEGVTEIGSFAFRDCAALTSVTLNGKLSTVGAYAFDGCDELTRVDITDLGAFCGIDFGDSSANPLHAARKLFANGKEMTAVTIPEGVTAIGKYAFYNFEGMTSLTLPADVISFGAYAFAGCTGLAHVYFAGSEEAWKTIDSLAAAYLPEGVNLHFDHQP